MSIGRRDKKPQQEISERQWRHPVSHTPQAPGKCPRCGRHDHWARECPLPREPEARGTGRQATGDQRQSHSMSRGPRFPSRDLSAVKCYHCNEKGHFSSSCPKTIADGETAAEQDRARRHGTVNGVFCRDNTGAI